MDLSNGVCVGALDEQSDGFWVLDVFLFLLLAAKNNNKSDLR